MIKKFYIIAILALTIVFSYIYQVNATTTGEHMSEYLATVRYEQKNGFTKDKIKEDYYSQEYSVYIDNVEIKNYKIDTLEGFPAGTYVANANTGEKQEEFSKNDTKFKIMVPIDKAEEDFIGTFKACMDFKAYITYYTYEGELMKGEINNSNEQVIKFDNRQSTLTINAIDAETLEGVSGVTVQVKDNTFNIIEELVTDRAGRAIVNKIGSGNASIKVINVPEEYVITGVEESKEVEHKERAEYNLELKRKKGSLRIENNAVNSVFEIYNSKGVLVGKYSTDEDGMIEINELDIGKYLLIQKQLPKGYLPIENQIFTINEGITSNLLIMNEIDETQIPNEDEEKGEEDGKEVEDNKEQDVKPSEDEQDKGQGENAPNVDEQDKAQGENAPNVNEQDKNEPNGDKQDITQDTNETEQDKNEQDKTPSIDNTTQNEQDKTLEDARPHRRPHKHKVECKCECCQKEQVEKPKDEVQNGNQQDEEKPNDKEANKEVQDDSKGENNKIPVIEGEENIASDKDNNSKEQEQDNEKGTANNSYEDEKKTENNSFEDEQDTEIDIIDKQSNSNIDEADLSTLPRTGDDYFLVKLIIFDIFMVAIFLLILNYKKQSAKKQTALEQNIKG